MSCKKLMAEGIGTFWLVFAGCGAVVLAGGAIGALGVSLAFGIALISMSYAVGPISGAHLNPAVTVGLVAAGRFESKEALGYIIAQVIGAIAAAWLIGQIGGGKAGFDMVASGMAANGFDGHSPGGYNMHAVLLTEIVMMAVFMFIVMGVSDSNSGNHGALAVGLAFALVYLVTIPITGGSINPARATGPAVLMGGWAVEQLWMFWVAPIIGAVVGAITYKKMDECD